MKKAMTHKTFEYQPGVILHEVIVGAFRANGTSFSVWCRENEITETNARQATYGQSRGVMGSAYLERIIEGAGREFVRAAYERRLREHYHQVFGEAA